MNEQNNHSSGRHYPSQDRLQKPRGGRYLSEAERQRRKKIRRRKIMIQRSILAGALMAILILIIVLIFKGCSGHPYAIAGKWYMGGSTYYEFDDDGTGTLILPNSIDEFSYKVKKNKLQIDYKDSSLTDGTYTFIVEDGKLTLIGGEGTSGDTYELIKIEND